MIGEEIPYIVAEATTILRGDHIPVIKTDGTVGVRWLTPGVYSAGEVIPEGQAPYPRPYSEMFER